MHNLKKRILFYITFLFSILLFITYDIYQYNNLIHNFKNNFDNYQFSKANYLLIYNQNSNLIKSIFLKNDLNKYFNNKLNTLPQKLNNGNISSMQYLNILKEINRYNLISSSKINKLESSIDLIKDSSNSYETAIKYYKEKKYDYAIKYFNKVDAMSLNFDNSIQYSNICHKKLQNSILDQCNKLIDKNYYTKALNLIETNKHLFNTNEFNTKTNDIKSKRQYYINKVSNATEASSKAMNSPILPSNINSLNITSHTKYLLTVDISKQKTYIYKNINSKWNLIKTFSCSTGSSKEKTPHGSFTIKERGKWFYSEQYKQGGKYWTQITGDILFHSFPYSKDKKTILDTTLNKPSSHGCIRLSTSDAKWIYDNIPQNSKVIIK